MSAGAVRGVAIRHAGSAIARAATTPSAARSRRSLAIGLSPDAAARVVRDEQRTIGKHEQSYHAAPAGAVRELPTRHEVLARHRLPVFHVDPDHLVAGGGGAAPRPVKRRE